MVGNLEKLDHFLSKGRLAEGPWQAFERDSRTFRACWF